MPQAAIRIFPQAVSKTASNVTSHASFFFSCILYPLPPHDVFLSFFLWISLKDLPFKQTRSRRWLRWKAGWGRWARRCEFCSPNLSVCFPLPAPEHRACKSFSCTALSQPLLAPFQKCAACFRKMEGTSLHGECCLPALVTTALALSLCPPLSLSLSFSLRLRQATALLPSVRQAQLSV